jgi:nitrite reductase (NADH) small subunit
MAGLCYLRGVAMAFLRAARKDEIPEGSVREFVVDGKTIALANVDGNFYAIDNTCLHRGGPLGQGELEGKVITCPWHGWQYDVTTGKVIVNAAVGVQTYALEVRGDDIFVDAS